MSVCGMPCGRLLLFYLALSKPARCPCRQTRRRRQPFQVRRLIHIEPSGPEFDTQPGSLDSPHRVFQRQRTAPRHAVEHSRVRCPARDRIVASIVGRPKRHIGIGGKQLLQMREGKRGRVGADDDGSGMPPAKSLIQRVKHF